MFQDGERWLSISIAVGCGVVSGILFDFSSFVMQSLLEIPDASAIKAMQAINRRIQNPLFFLFFMGTALASVAFLVLSYTKWRQRLPDIRARIAAGLYVVGVFLVTAAFNVPLNNQLDKVDPNGANASKAWRQDYVTPWMRWNHVRTALGILAMFLMVWALADRPPVDAVADEQYSHVRDDDL